MRRHERAELLDRLTALRHQYAMRGPRDGRIGLTPEGTVSPAVSYHVTAVMADAEARLELSKDDYSRWRAALGLDPEPAPVEPVKAKASPWKEQCPARGAGLEHAHWNECRGEHPGTGEKHGRFACCHCGEIPR